jgi:Domain of unknown function (DUF1905)
VAVVLDDEQVAAVGEGAKRFPVAASINGHAWQGTVVRMRGQFLPELSKGGPRPGGVEAQTLEMLRAGETRS